MNFTARMAANKGDRMEPGDIHLDFGCCHTDSPIPAEVIHPLDGAPADPSSQPALAVQHAGSNPRRGPLPFEPMRLHASACSRSIRARSRYNSRNISREREGAATPFFTSILAHESSSDAKVKPRLFLASLPSVAAGFFCLVAEKDIADGRTTGRGKKQGGIH